MWLLVFLNLYKGIFWSCWLCFCTTHFNTETLNSYNKRKQLTWLFWFSVLHLSSSEPPASLDAVWSRKAQSAPTDGGVGHKFTQTRLQWNSTENTDINTVGTSCIFQYSCLCVSQVFSESRVSNWLLNNKLVAVNQTISNKCHLVFSCTLILFLFWGLSLSFCSFELPHCSNS